MQAKKAKPPVNNLKRAIELNDILFDVAERLKELRRVRYADHVGKQQIADNLVAKFNAEQEMRRVMPLLTEDEGKQVQKLWQKRHEALQAAV